MLMQRLKKGSIVLIAALITSCTNMQTDYFTQTVSSWHGSHVNTLTQYWGKPGKKVTTLSGSTMYVYKKQELRLGNGNRNPQIGVNYSKGGSPVVTTQTNTQWNNGMTLFCIVAFEVNKQGVVVDEQTQGNNCYADSQFMKTMKNPEKQ